MTFKNREEAGRRLAERLTPYREDEAALILALPRGGVAVGYQLSLDLHLPLDVFIARKLGAPDNPEYALGAVGETGTIYLNPDAMAAYGLSRSDLEEVVQAQQTVKMKWCVDCHKSNQASISCTLCHELGQ